MFSGIILSSLLMTADAAEIRAKDHNKTNVSGHSGTEKKLSTGKHSFLFGFGWSERSDKPCYLRSGDAKVYVEDGKNGYITKTKSYEECTEKSSSYKAIFFELDGNAKTERFITGVKVCTSDKKDSKKEYLKGVKIRSAKLNAKGKVINDNAEESVVRTNCKLWHDWAECKKGQVATSLITVSDSSGVRGLRLQCATPFLTKDETMESINGGGGKGVPGK